VLPDWCLFRASSYQFFSPPLKWFGSLPEYTSLLVGRVCPLLVRNARAPAGPTQDFFALFDDERDSSVCSRMRERSAVPSRILFHNPFGSNFFTPQEMYVLPSNFVFSLSCFFFLTVLSKTGTRPALARLICDFELHRGRVCSF